MIDGDSIDAMLKQVNIGHWGVYPEQRASWTLGHRTGCSRHFLDTLMVVTFNPFVSQLDANIIPSAERPALMHYADEQHSGEIDLKID